MVLENSLFGAILDDNLIHLQHLLSKDSFFCEQFVRKIPLHISVLNPDILKFLIEVGANVNDVNIVGDTPLHSAVGFGVKETVCMLLYYNADVNARNLKNITPFMTSLMTGYVEIQKILLDYVDFQEDHRDENIVALAVKYNSPLAYEIVLRGAKVNCKALEYFNYSDENLPLFKLIWQNIPNSKINSHIGQNFIYMLCEGLLTTKMGSYLDFVIENSKETRIKHLASSLSLFPLKHFIKRCAFAGCLKQLTKFICLLLQYDLKFTHRTLFDIYETFGNCELFKIMLHFDPVIDLKYSHITFGGSILPTYLFFVKSDIQTICNNINIAYLENRHNFNALIRTMTYWAHPTLLTLLTEVQKKYHPRRKLSYTDIPRFPSLLELARDTTRKHIVNKFNIDDASQYYTYINNLNIHKIYKDILTFDKKIYTVDLHICRCI